MNKKTTILKALVGSRAHGLHTKDSDYDYRSVYVLPTTKILSLGHKYKGSESIEGSIDNTNYEIGHFLMLATKANPSILEVLVSKERTTTSKYAEEMTNLLPYMYNPKDAYNAFVGYSRNQRKKFLDNENDISRYKYAVSYIRTLYNLRNLLVYGTFSLEVTDNVVRNRLLQIKSGDVSCGEIIDLCESLIKLSDAVIDKAKNRQDLDMVNDFLIRVRKDFM